MDTKNRKGTPRSANSKQQINCNTSKRKVKWGAFKFKADANKICKEIEKIGDNATPEQIVDFARDKKSELHKCFEWNDSIAAEKYRLQQARVIMCNIVYADHNNTSEAAKIRVYQSVGNTYKPSVQIIQNEDEYKLLLNRAYAELRSFKQRYKTLSELEPILALIE